MKIADIDSGVYRDGHSPSRDIMSSSNCQDKLPPSEPQLRGGDDAIDGDKAEGIPSAEPRHGELQLDRESDRTSSLGTPSPVNEASNERPGSDVGPATQQPKKDAPTEGAAASSSPLIKARTRSETTLTSYEALEDNLKGAGSATAPASAAAPSETTSDQSSSSSRAQSHSEQRGPPKIITTSSRPGSSNKPKRRGKWTVEEEAYVARVIQDFNSGFLDAPAGTTLRTYLSEKLQCDPMRITKKFTGDACIGKRVFHPAVRSPGNAAAIDKAQSELDQLERRWRRRLEMQQRESAKKAAASVAAVAAGRDGVDAGLDGEDGRPPQKENVVTRTASWLDRAKSVLTEPSNEKEPRDNDSDDLHSQMKEVQRLIHEGPAIQQTSAGLPDMIDKAQEEARASTSSPEVEPADKRLRTAEDAEALVGFLRSVRASAESGQSF